MEKIHRVVYLMFVLPLLFGCKQSVNNNFGKKKNEAFFEKIDSIEVKPLLDIDTCIAINDDYYNKFITEISCDEAMEILEQNMDSKRKVYAKSGKDKIMSVRRLYCYFQNFYFDTN